MRNRAVVRFTLIVAALALLFGCASAPSGTQSGGSGERDIPEWVSNPPADTADEVYFVGAGSDSGGSEAEARRQAASDLVSSVTRFLGVRVTSDTTVEAKDTLDQFTSSLSQTITEESEARLSNFRIVDSFVEYRGGIANVYVLGEYDKNALMEEKARLEALFAEQQEAVSGPELEGDRLFGQNKFYDAAVQYLTAATAAYKSGIDNAAIKYERNMNKAREAIAKIELNKLNDDLTADIKQPFTTPFRLLVTAQGLPSGDGLAGVPVKIVYKEIRSNGRARMAQDVIMTNGQGLVEFTRPAPQFVGREQLSMELDFSSNLETLENVPDKYYGQLESVEQRIADKQVQFSYTVVSQAREVPTALMIADLDNGGTVLDKNETVSGVLEVLSDEGFSVGTLPVDIDLLRGSDSQLIEQVRSRYGDRYDRVVFGTVSISDFREDGSRYMVKVSGNIKAADLETGEILYSSGSMFKSALGQNLQSAMSAAFKQFGKMIGESLTMSLP